MSNQPISLSSEVDSHFKKLTSELKAALAVAKKEVEADSRPGERIRTIRAFTRLLRCFKVLSNFSHMSAESRQGWHNWYTSKYEELLMLIEEQRRWSRSGAKALTPFLKVSLPSARQSFYSKTATVESCLVEIEKEDKAKIAQSNKLCQEFKESLTAEQKDIILRAIKLKHNGTHAVIANLICLRLKLD